MVPSHDPSPVRVGSEAMGGISQVEPTRHLKADHARDVKVTAEPDDPRQLLRHILVSGGDHRLWRAEGKADQPIGPIRRAWKRPEAV